MEGQVKLVFENGWPATSIDIHRVVSVLGELDLKRIMRVHYMREHIEPVDVKIVVQALCARPNRALNRTCAHDTKSALFDNQTHFCQQLVVTTHADFWLARGARWRRAAAEARRRVPLKSDSSTWVSRPESHCLLPSVLDGPISLFLVLLHFVKYQHGAKARVRAGSFAGRFAFQPFLLGCAALLFPVSLSLSIDLLSRVF